MTDPSTLPTPPGSNLECGSSDSSNTARLRREWNHLDDFDRALYLDAIETAIERGLHQRFAIFHFDTVSEIQAHDTCGFYLWHRIFVLAYENMLRSLEPRFACLTLPFWDIHRDYEKQESSASSCRSYATCAKVINDLGGLVENDDMHERTYFGRTVEGLWHFKPPVQNLRDDDNRVGVIRYDLWYDPIPDDAGLLSVDSIARLFGTVDRAAFWEILHHGIHDSVHDTIGGIMRTPASPIDPLFMPWHSTMELFDYIWEACHSAEEEKADAAKNPASISDGTDDAAALAAADADAAAVSDLDYGGEGCLYSRHAREVFPNISLASDAVYMKLGNATDIREDPQIGAYFSHAMKFSDLRTIRDLDVHHRFRYAGIPENFVRALANNTRACPNGLSSILSLRDGAIDEDDDDGGGALSGSFAGRQPPSFSDQQLASFRRGWVEEAEAYYGGGSSTATAANGSLDAELQRRRYANNVNFVRCILFEAMDRDTIERWAIDEGTFLTQVVTNKRYDNHPLCRDRLSDASVAPDADKGTDVANDGFADFTTNTTAANSGGDSRGRQIAPCWLSTVLLIWIVSKFTR